MAGIGVPVKSWKTFILNRVITTKHKVTHPAHVPYGARPPPHLLMLCRHETLSTHFPISFFFLFGRCNLLSTALSETGAGTST